MLQAHAITKPAGRWLALPAFSPRAAQLLFILAVAAGATAGIVLQDPAASARALAAAGPDLTRVLRFMAGFKALLVLATSAAVLWRLNTPVTAARFAAYAALSALGALGAVDIWQMARPGLGGVMVDAGIVGTVALLWLDPATHQRLALAIKNRRSRNADGAGA